MITSKHCAGYHEEYVYSSWNYEYRATCRACRDCRADQRCRTGCDTKNCYALARTESPSCGRRPSKDAATNKRPSRVTSKASSNVSRPGGIRWKSDGLESLDSHYFFHQKKGLFVTPILVIIMVNQGESHGESWVWLVVTIKKVASCARRSSVRAAMKMIHVLWAAWCHDDWDTSNWAIGSSTTGLGDDMNPFSWETDKPTGIMKWDRGMFNGLLWVWFENRIFQNPLVT